MACFSINQLSEWQLSLVFLTFVKPHHIYLLFILFLSLLLAYSFTLYTIESSYR